MALLEIDFRSGALGFHEEVVVSLPDRPADRPFPVLWLFHGANQDCTEWLRATSIDRYANSRGLAVVMPAMSNGHGQNMVHGSNYWNMINQELPAALRYMLPCLSWNKEENFTAGASMGGYVAYKLALNNPDKYCAAGAFGGALDIVGILSGSAGDGGIGLSDTFVNAFGNADHIRGTDGDLIWMASNLAKERRCPRLWSLVGDGDFGFGQVTGAVAQFRNAGCDITDLQDKGGHSFDLWDRYVETFLDWLDIPKGVN